LLSEPCVGLV